MYIDGRDVFKKREREKCLCLYFLFYLVYDWSKFIWVNVGF